MSEVATAGADRARVPFAGFDKFERPLDPAAPVERVHHVVLPRRWTKRGKGKWIYPPVVPYDEWVPVLMPSGHTTDPKRFLHNSSANWHFIVEQVARRHGVALKDIMGHRRYRPIVAARHECFYELAEQTNMSLPAIGKKLGDKDHTTVIHGIRKHKERMSSNFIHANHTYQQEGPLDTRKGLAAQAEPARTVEPV